MKIINEKGKLFGIINVVDLLALLALLAVIGGVGYKLFANRITDAVSPKVDITTTILVRGAQPYLVEELQRNSPVGKPMVNGTAFLEDASIESMEFSDYVQQLSTSDGRLVDFIDGRRKDVTFVIRGKVAKDSAVLKIGSQEVRAGRTFYVKTNDFEVAGNIISVVVGD